MNKQISQGETRMNLLELFVIAVGLSMDAFAVSICKGLALRQMSWKKAALAGLYFGGFQAGMPLLGYMLGVRFQGLIASVDHWIAFVLLCLIGGNMVRESLKNQEVDGLDDSFDVKTMLMLAVATSIDALAVGVTFAFLNVRIVPAVSFIGTVTFCLSAAGIKAGNLFGNKYESKAELAGGVILIVMGTKILLDHLGVL